MSLVLFYPEKNSLTFRLVSTNNAKALGMIFDSIYTLNKLPWKLSLFANLKGEIFYWNRNGITQKKN